MTGISMGIRLASAQSPSAALFSEFPGASMAADFTKGLYYADGAKSLGQFLTNVPAGQPTASGLYVTSPSQPLMVQGRGSELANLTLFDKRAGTAGTVTFPAGILRFVNAVSGLSTAVSQELTGLVIGRTYELRAILRSVSGGSVTAEFRTGSGGGGSGLASSPGEGGSLFAEVFVRWIATQTSIHANIKAATGSVFEVQSASVQEVLPFAGYDPAVNDLTFGVEWSSATVGATKRVLAAYALNSTDYVELFLDTDNGLKLRSVTGGTQRGIVTVTGKDDAGTHRATCYINRSTGALKLECDGGTVQTATASAMPAGLAYGYLGHNNNSNQLNGYVRLTGAVSADQFDAWR